MGVVPQPVTVAVARVFGHELIEACQVQAGADRDGAFFLGRIDNP